ncbi:AMP-binding protein, partial [Vibrio bathopelagicus]
ISDKVSSYIDNNKGLYSTNGFVTPSAIKDEFGCIFNYLYLKKCDNSKFTVGIFLDRDYRYLLTLLACMKAGITYVPLSRKLPIARVNQIVKVSEIDMVVSDIDSNFESNSVYIQDIIDLKLEAGNVSVSYDEKQPLYIMFTSGSTGTPKGVIIPRSAYESFLKWMDEYYDVNSSDKMLFITEFTFDISLVDVGLLVLNNMDFYFSKFNGNIIDVMQELEAFEINIMSTVPSNLTMLLSNKIINRFKIEPLKLLILSGSKITKKLYDLVLGFFPTTMFYNGYGPTEATIFISCKYFDGRFDFEGPNASVGHEVSDMNIILLGNDKKQVNKGSVGEVFVSGNQLMSGYINNPERTNDVLTTIDEVTYYSVG